MNGTEGAGWDPKAEAVRLWEADPCGGAVGPFREGTPEFFAAVDTERYHRSVRWMSVAIGFDRFAGKRVLEVGCGMGTDLAQFVRGGAVAFGLDLTPHHLRIARERLRSEGAPLRLVRSDGERLPFRDGSLDVVYSFGVLHHTPGIGAAVEEIWRVLRPGGSAIIGLYHRASVFYWIHTILVRGILHGLLLRKGYRRLMADIERHTHSNAMPLVRVYSRKGLHDLLSRFNSVTTEIHHLEANHFSYLAAVVRRLPGSLLERWSRHWGWYVIAKARK